MEEQKNSGSAFGKRMYETTFSEQNTKTIYRRLKLKDID